MHAGRRVRVRRRHPLWSRSFENVFTFTPSGDETVIERTTSFMAPTQALDGLKAMDGDVTLRRDTALQMLKERLEEGSS